MIILGIDPGKAGSLAAINDRMEVILMVDMPTNDKGYLNAILKHSFAPDRTYLESVHALPGQSTVAGFSYGKNVGKAELLAESFGNVVQVSPVKWKKELGLVRREGESKTDFKHRSVELARQLFPEVSKELKISKDGRAEALLIAYYGLKNNT